MATDLDRRNGWWRRWLKLRDILLFTGGMAGTGYETLQGHPAVDLLILFGGMVGVPIFLPGGIKMEFSYRSKKAQAAAKVDVSQRGIHGNGHEDG